MPQTTLDRDRLERLIALGRTLLSELDVEVVLDRVLETARQMTGARFAGLGILDDDRREISEFISRGVDAPTQDAIGHAPRGLGTLGVLMADPRPLRIADVAGHPQFSGFPRGHPPMRSFLGVPIVIRGEAWGNLYLADKVDGEFDQADEDALVVLADWAAIAIENARLYHRLDGAVRGFEATSAIARAVGGKADIDPVLELIVDRAKALVDARAVLVLLRDGDELVVAAVAGQLDLRNRPRLPLTGSIAGEVLRDGHARRAGSLELDVGVPDPTAALLVPLAYRGEGLGALVVFDRLTGDPRFTAADEDVLTAFAASAATAVATARTVEAERLRRSIEAAEAERRRWARELHDEMLQGLGSLQMQMWRAAAADDPELKDGVLRQAIEDLSREIENLRAIITELRPAALDQLGLEPALRSLAKRTADIEGLVVATDFALGGDGHRLSPELETTVYRLVQEALTNVVKHARASRVEIVVREKAGALEVTVADNGAGFDAARATSGYGLLGMRERVELAGGGLRVEPGPAGTVVSARLPLPADQRS